MFALPIRALPLATVLTVCAFACSPACANITLDNQKATVGSYYKAVFKVPHGCKGSPTLKLRV